MKTMKENIATKRKLLTSISAACLIGLSANVNAASVYLTPASTTVALSDGAAAFELYMDFTGEPTVGGGLDVDTNGAVAFNSFIPSSYFLDIADPSFSGFGTVLADNDYEIHFGDFFGLSGINHLGTITVDLLNTGTGSIDLAINSMWGDFYQATGSFGQQSVTLSGASINVTTVPLPASVWLLFGGLASLVSVARKK
jgi:hypothetical protein